MLRSLRLISYTATQKKVLSYEGYLNIRNSDFIEIQIPVPEKKETLAIQLPKTSTLSDLTK